jgi:arsenate reductase (glutaredoxin)
MLIYHNPRCGKSRTALQFLKDKGLSPEIRLYLSDAPDESELRLMLKQLGLPAEDLVRKNEDIYIKEFKGKIFKEDEWIRILAANPILIQRPVIITDKGAVIARSQQELERLFH